ncbi:hypothetical protein M1145_02980, partial [Patescibacteria group bacterium]|nr:hypothetical protein [Patescibacteria group bacterium]
NASEEEKQKQQENLEYILKNFESKYPDKFDSTKKETENYGKLTNNEKSKLLKDLRESKFQMVEPKTTEPEKKVTELTIDSNPEVFSKFVDGLTEDELTDLSRKVLTFVGSATFKDTAQIADMFSNKLVVGNASEEEKQKQQENLEYILKNFKSKYPDKFDSTKKETENYRKLTNNEKSKLFKDLRESKFQMVEPKTTEPEKVTELTVDSNPEVFQKYIEVASPKDIIILNNFAKELLSVANRGLSIEGKSKLEHLLSNTLVTDGIELTEDEIRNIVSNIKTLIEYAELHELPETAEEDVSSHSSKESTFLFDAKSAYKAITDIKIPIDTETKETTKAVTNVTDESTSEVTDITDIPKLPDDSNALFIGLVTGYKSNNEEEQKMLDKIKEYIKSKPELLEDENESMRLAIERAMKFTTEARNRIVATQVRRSIFAGLIGVGAGVAIGELVRPLLEHSTKLAIPVHGLRGHNIQKIVTNHGHNANSIHSVSQHVGKNPKLPGVTPNTEKLGNIGSVTLKPGDTVWGILQSKGIQPESQKGLTTIVNMFRNNPHFLESAKIIAKNEGAGKTLSMISNPNVPVSNILKQFTPQQIMHAAHWIPSSGNITL